MAAPRGSSLARLLGLHACVVSGGRVAAAGLGDWLMLQAEKVADAPSRGWLCLHARVIAQLHRRGAAAGAAAH
jgi:hypothetical protein